jgi:hypothetical protein
LGEKYISSKEQLFVKRKFKEYELEVIDTAVSVTNKVMKESSQLFEEDLAGKIPNQLIVQFSCVYTCTGVSQFIHLR